MSHSNIARSDKLWIDAGVYGNTRIEYSSSFLWLLEEIHNSNKNI